MDGVFREGTVLLDKYRVDSVLGQGGMGVVLKVTHLQLGEELAIKILAPAAAASAEVHGRFVREAQAAVRLRGEHVTRTFDVGALPNGAPYLVMEYLRGVDLAGELDRRKALAPGDAVDYVLQACEALAEAHANGIVHRDIKPGNLFLTTRPDGTPLIKVLDFGISKAPARGHGLVTRTDIVMGTPGYMSPEQLKATREVDGRTDIWALGVVLYECLNGRRPFDAEQFSVYVLAAATERPPPMDPRIPRGLQAAVLRCLEKDRAARFPSIAALAAALAPFARDQRAAATIVDRTRLMSRGPHDGIEIAPVSQSPVATTLSSSAGVTRSQSSRRHYVAAFIAMLGVAAAVIVTAVRYTMRDAEQSDGEAIASNATTDAAATTAAKPVAAVTAPLQAPTTAAAADVAAPVPAVATPPKPPDDGEMHGREPAPTIAPAKTRDDAVVRPGEQVAAVATPPKPVVATPPTPDQVKAQTRTCTDAMTRKDWRGLADCAVALDALGAKVKAGELRDKAQRETQNEARNAAVNLALKAGNLKAAQAALGELANDSVYSRAARDAFSKAEARAADQATRSAQAFANASDCTALKGYAQQLRDTSTERVAVAVAKIPCTPQQALDPTLVKELEESANTPAIAAAPPTTPSPPSGDAPTQAVAASSAGPVEPSPPAPTPAPASRSSPPSSEAPPSAPPPSAPPPSAPRASVASQPPSASPAAKRGCASKSIDALLAQAANQYSAGYAKTALALTVDALACTQDVKMYRLAAMYACAARDRANAKLYFEKLPAAQRAPVEQRCQQEGIDVRAP